MLQAIGLFNPLLRETIELYYQYQYDYIFDSSKFESSFNLSPTSYENRVRSLSQTLFASKK